jgi:glycerol-3-phosphate acyltransferase PlsY
LLTVIALGGYLLGSVPFGVLVGWLRGVDVRREGSGNIGAANVARLMGPAWGVLVFALDVAKGLAPTLAAGWAIGTFAGAVASSREYALWFGVGCAALVGHVFPVYLGFRGGKGVATGLGVICGVYPYLTGAALVGLAAWGVVLWLTGYFSVASLSAGVVVPIAYWVMGAAFDWPLAEQWPLSVIGMGVFGLVLARHAGNVRRLRAGTEPRAWRRAKAANHDRD